MDALVDADFYSLEQLLDPPGREQLLAVREFMEKSVAPVINYYWTREEFPHDLVPGLADLGIAGLACDGYGCPGGSRLLDGMIAMGYTLGTATDSTGTPLTGGFHDASRVTTLFSPGKTEPNAGSDGGN